MLDETTPEGEPSYPEKITHEEIEQDIKQGYDTEERMTDAEKEASEERYREVFLRWFEKVAEEEEASKNPVEKAYGSIVRKIIEATEKGKETEVQLDEDKRTKTGEFKTFMRTGGFLLLTDACGILSKGKLRLDSEGGYGGRVYEIVDSAKRDAEIEASEEKNQEIFREWFQAITKEEESEDPTRSAYASLMRKVIEATEKGKKSRIQVDEDERTKTMDFKIAMRIGGFDLLKAACSILSKNEALVLESEDSPYSPRAVKIRKYFESR